MVEALARSVDEVVAVSRHTVTDTTRLLRELGKVRKLGYAVVSEELELGVLGIAAPIRDRKANVVAALNISTNLARRIEREMVREFKEPLLGAVAAIEKNLPPK